MKQQSTKGLHGLFVLLFIFLFLNACSSEKGVSLDNYIASENDGSSQEALQEEKTGENTVQENDDVQTVTLSWGKLNYNPETITVTAGKPVKIIADLTRLRGCFQSLVIPGLGIETYFDENNPFVEFIPTEKGTFTFSCSMGMGKGTLMVK